MEANEALALADSLVDVVENLRKAENQIDKGDNNVCPQE
jgi:hypothetical protein